MKENYHVVTKAENEKICLKITQDSEVCRCDILEQPVFSIPIQTKKHLYIEDTTNSNNLQFDLIANNIKSWVCIPLYAEDTILGLLLIEKTVKNGFLPSDIELAEALTAQASTALQNALLFQKVSEAEIKLRQLAHKVVLSQEEERKLISRDLHDEAGQALTAIKIGLKLIQTEIHDNQPTIKTRLLELTELTDTTISQIRNLAQNLRPPILDTIGLDLTLEDYCERFTERTNIKVNYHSSNLPKLQEAINICLYRCVQEALNNVAKHANAKNVNVSLSYEDKVLRLLVQDDGKGFEINQNHIHAAGKIGIIGMRERVSLLNGEIQIESTRNFGVKITVEIPFEEEK
jgi:signal transduction histidine kinase